ncbi:MAG: hypothetical protein ACI87E_005062 [Mariniblastus sp.]
MEHVLFEKMGVSVEGAFATGADFIDEKVSQATEQGVEVEPRIGDLLEILLKVTEPKNMAALNTLVERLPQLTKLAQLADQVPNLIATFGDLIDDFQQRCASEGIDMEKSLTNGLHAALRLGTYFEKDDLERLGELLKSDMLNHNSISVLSNAANSMASAQRDTCDSKIPERVGLLGLIGLLRNPDIQKSLAFASKFGECFGKNIG